MKCKRTNREPRPRAVDKWKGCETPVRPIDLDDRWTECMYIAIDIVGG